MRRDTLFAHPNARGQRKEEGEEGEGRRQGAGEGRGAFRTEKQPPTKREEESERREV